MNCDRHFPSSLFAFVLAFLVAAAVLIAPQSAEAKNVSGKFGLGLDNTLNAATLGIAPPATSSSPNAPSMGLSFRYWINNEWGLDGVFGFGYASGKATEQWLEDPDGYWAFTLDFKVYYSFHHGEMTNFSLFWDIHFQKENSTNARPAGPYESNFGFALATGFSPEVFLTDNFALCAEFGLTFRVQQGFAFSLGGDNLLGGFGFHYYF